MKNSTYYKCLSELIGYIEGREKDAEENAANYLEQLNEMEEDERKSSYTNRWLEEAKEQLKALVCFHQGAPCCGTDRGLRHRCVSALLLIRSFLPNAFWCFIIQHFALLRFCRACATGSRRCHDQIFL